MPAYNHLDSGMEYFSSSVSIDGTMYYGYYIPVFQSGAEKPVGMVFVGANKADKDAVVDKIVNIIIITVCIVMACCIFAVIVTFLYAVSDIPACCKALCVILFTAISTSCIDWFVSVVVLSSSSDALSTAFVLSDIASILLTSSFLSCSIAL